MTFPEGLPTRTLTFGRYSNALGTNVGGSVSASFDDPMLHTPTGEVITGSEERATIGNTGMLSLEVPVTVTEDLIANWRDPGAYSNQRLKVRIDVAGYRSETLYVDIHADDPMIIDFDQMSKYTAVGGVPVTRAQVVSVAGLTGVVGATALAGALASYFDAAELSPEEMQELVDQVSTNLDPPVDLVLLFENALG